MRYLLLMLSLLAGSATADDLVSPKGDVLLTISGKITRSNSERGAEFDMQMLEQLGTTTFATNTPWTDAVTLFSGVRLSALLKAVGAQSSAIRALALDNYWYDIKDIDWEEYPVIVAYKRDEKYMSARNLGPLWIMFPFDEFPELLTEAFKASSVWHLDSLVVQ